MLFTLAPQCAMLPGLFIFSFSDSMVMQTNYRVMKIIFEQELQEFMIQTFGISLMYLKVRGGFKSL